MNKLMTETFYAVVIACLYILTGYMLANIYVVVRDLVKAIYHLCIGG